MPAATDRLHPRARAILDQISGWAPLHSLTPSEARALPVLLAPAPQPVASVIERGIAGPGGPMLVRIYRPEGTPHGALVHFHGGGWVTGSLASADAMCRSLANGAHCVVVSVDYRLAPEAKFPEPVEDAYAAVRAVAGDSTAFGVPEARIAVGGSSAGANLAVAAAIVARDRRGPKLAFQLLFEPVVELSYGSRSHEEFGEGYGLSRLDMEWYATQYVRTTADADDPYASVLRADLRGLPPALVITAECDPLRDDAESYADKLAAVGIRARAKRYAGMFHGFAAFPDVLPEAAEAQSDAVAALRSAFSVDARAR